MSRMRGDEESSSISPRRSSKSRKSRSRSYNDDRDDSSSRSRSRERPKNNKRSWVVFVRNLHENVTDDDLRKHFEDCGHVIDASVIRDRKYNRIKGFGFVAFATEEDQKTAILDKNGTTLFNKNIVVQISTRKTTVYVGNLPWDFSSDSDANDLQRVIEERCGRRILTIRLKGRYAFCEFLNFEHTQAALQKLPGLVYRGRELRIQLANSTRAEEDLMSSENLKKTLFVRNISQDVNERDLRHSFEKYGDLTRCEIIRDRAGEQRDYGFVAFKERSQTEHAYRDMHRCSLGGKEICVEYAKSKDSSRERSRRRDRSRSRESHRSKSRRDTQPRRPVQRLEIDDVLARGWPVLAYDTTVGRMVLLSSEAKKLGRSQSSRTSRRRY